MPSNDLLQPLLADDWEKLSRDAASSALILILVGGIYILSSVPIALAVLTQHKIAEDPTGPSAEIVHASQTLFWVGWAAASFLTTPLVDKCGRRGPMYALTALGLAATVAETLATAAWSYAAALLVVGSTLPVAGQIAYVLLQETLPEQLRARAIIALNVGFAGIGVAAAAVGGTLARGLGWRVETLLWHVPHALLLLVGCLVVDESPQFMTGKVVDSRPEATGFLGPGRMLLTSPLFGRLALIVLCWMACSLGYFGLSYTSGSLSPYLYTNYALLSGMDIVGSLLSRPVVESLGAKQTQAIACFCAGGNLLMCALLPANTWQMGFAMLGRLFLDIAFVTIYLLLIDCFPTECRGTAAGIANCLVRFITLVTPLLKPLPLSQTCVFMATLCLACCPATWMLPQSMAKQTRSSHACKGCERSTSKGVQDQSMFPSDLEGQWGGCTEGGRRAAKLPSRTRSGPTKGSSQRPPRSRAAMANGA